MSVTIAGNILVQSNGQPIPISLGGTGQTTAPTAINALLPTQTGNSGKVLTTNGTNVSWATGGSAAAAGSDTQIQFNDNGAFGATPNLTVNKTTGAITSTAPTTSQSVVINDAVQTYRTLSYQTVGSNRWLLQANNSAENGTGLGSNLELVRVADNGLTQNIVFSVARNSGVVDFKTTPTINGVSIVTTATNTPALTATQIAFGDVSNLMTSSPNLNWDNPNIALNIAYLQLGFNTASNAVYFTTGTGRYNDFFINPVDITSSNVAGQFVVRAANNLNFPGGTLTLKGGNNTNIDNGGAVAISAGNATGTTGTGGSVTIHAGTGVTAGGAVVFNTGATTTLIERFRIQPAGAWSVGPNGTDVGTTGYVLTSNGTGTPPTWSPATGGGGSVSSVDVSGGTTGLTTSGGPITTSGTITLTGTLAIANGGTGQTSASAAINALVPTQTGNSGKFLTTNGSAVSWGSAGTVTSVSVTTANGVSGSVATSTTTPAITLTLGAITPTSISSARINPRTNSVTTGTTITPAGDTSDVYYVTALASAATVAAPSGTPVAGQKLLLNILDNGTSRGLTWTTTSGAYRAVGVTLPSATTAGKEMYVGCIWNANATFWDVIAIAQQ